VSKHRPVEALADLERVLRRLKVREIDGLEKALLEARRIFVTGLGRTGLMARGFAMRLMHLGRTVYHVGDVITPAIGPDDVLVICSRTGGSKMLGHYIDIARRAKARVAVITARPTSPVGRRADVVVSIDDRPLRRRRTRPPLPLGSLFEQALLITLDHVVLDLMTALNLGEADLARIHTDFE
jgi:6-phospho-3-hexuloisomerase